MVRAPFSSKKVRPLFSPQPLRTHGLVRLGSAAHPTFLASASLVEIGNRKWLSQNARVLISQQDCERSKLLCGPFDETAAYPAGTRPADPHLCGTSLDTFPPVFPSAAGPCCFKLHSRA